MEPTVRLTGKTRTAFYTRGEADAVQRPRTSVVVPRESTNTGFTLADITAARVAAECVHLLGSHTPRRTPFRPIAIVCRVSCASDFLQARPPSSPFEGREDGRDVSDRRLLPDSSTTSTRASSVPVRVSSHGASDVFTTSLALRRAVQKVRGEFSSPDCALRFEVPHLTTTEPLTPLSLPSIRILALGAQSRFVEGRRDRFHRLRVNADCFRDPRCLPSFGNPTRPLRASFPRREEPPGPSSIPRLCRRGPTRTTSLRTPAPRRRLSPCEDAHPEETDALRETLQRVATLLRLAG